MDVYLLQHVHRFDEDDDSDEDVKVIGVYSTRDSAEAAIARLSVQPGFRDALDGFAIDRYPLDEDNWCEGYVTVTAGEDDVDEEPPA